MTSHSLYSIRKFQSTVEFVHATPSDLILPESQDLRASVPWSEVKRMAKQTSSVLTRDIIFPASIDDYNRLLTYCAARQNCLMQDNESLMKLVIGLNGYDLSYWAMYFKRSFWTHSSIEHISKAFLLFFGMVPNG